MGGLGNFIGAFRGKKKEEVGEAEESKRKEESKGAEAPTVITTSKGDQVIRKREVKINREEILKDASEEPEPAEGPKRKVDEERLKRVLERIEKQSKRARRDPGDEEKTEATREKQEGTGPSSEIESTSAEEKKSTEEGEAPAPEEKIQT